MILFNFLFFLERLTDMGFKQFEERILKEPWIQQTAGHIFVWSVFLCFLQHFLILLYLFEITSHAASFLLLALKAQNKNLFFAAGLFFSGQSEKANSELFLDQNQVLT